MCSAESGNAMSVGAGTPQVRGRSGGKEGLSSAGIATSHSDDRLKAAKVQDALSGEPAVYVGDLIRISIALLKEWDKLPDHETTVIEISRIEKRDGYVLLAAKWPTR